MSVRKKPFVTEQDLPKWVNFSLGEDVRDERRQEQDKKWADAVADGRQHFSHREFALEYARQFEESIGMFTLVNMLLHAVQCKKSIFSKVDIEIVSIIVEYALPGQAELVTAWRARCDNLKATLAFFLQRRQQALLPLKLKNTPHTASYERDDGNILLYLRKRPILPFEKQKGCYDCVRVLNTQEVVFHEGKLARNGRLLSMTHHRMLFDRVFSEQEDNAAVCQEVVSRLMEQALAGQKSTLLCFGQTGTGKTYTLYGVLKFIAKTLLPMRRTVRLCFYEVQNKEAFDLLNERQKIHLRFDAQGEVHVRGARVVTLTPG
ncbi:hypothetical protein EON64_20740, partial [archaeon]